MVVTGSKKLADSEEACKKYVSIIMRAGFPAKFEDFTVQNITGTCSFGFPISLEGFLYAYATNSTYEPELFPGLVYRMVTPKVVLLIYVSGNVVITGAKKDEDLVAAVNEIYPLLLEYRKKNVIISLKKRKLSQIENT